MTLSVEVNFGCGVSKRDDSPMNEAILTALEIADAAIGAELRQFSAGALGACVLVILGCL